MSQPPNQQMSVAGQMPASYPGRPAASDAQVMMAYDANKKSTGVSYLLWFFLGGLGGHNFYLGRQGPAFGQIALFVLGWLLMVVGIGLVLLAGLGVWVIIDAFLIPGFVRQRNNELAQRLGASIPYV